MKSRIHKILSQEGIASRREIESLILQERIEVNGRKAFIGQLISHKDEVKLDGKKIIFSNSNEQVRILMYHKRVGEISTRKDVDGRGTIFDSLPKIQSGRWISVGRLDINTSGLILFTNKGDLANKLMHPSSNIEREYIARIHGKVNAQILDNLIKGVHLKDGLAKFTDIKEGKKGRTNQWFAMVIMEGRTREVRRLWESQGLNVARLKRVRFGGIFLPFDLKGGSWRDLTNKEIQSIKHQ